MTAAVVLLLVAVVVVVWLAARGGEGPRGDAALRTATAAVIEAAERAGCPRERVEVDAPDGAGDSAWLVTARVPANFDLERFVLGVQAAAHNSGGRVDSLPLVEGGGYGLARLEGEIAGEPVRVVVIGERAVRRRPSAPRGGTPTPRLAVVLDDAGNSLADVAAIGTLPPDVAVAVLANAPHAAAVARALGAERREILLHMPMEPLAGAVPGPGPGALAAGQDAAEVQRLLEQALATVAGARGINNHMGSLATADRRLMRLVMSEVRSRGLYFIDSRTSSDSVALEVALELGVPAAERDVFLDVIEEPAAIRRALAQAVSEARASGRAVAIGHVHPVTISTLSVELPRLTAEGVVLVRPSRLLGNRR